MKIYPERFAPFYGGIDSEKISEVYKLLSCGDYRNGFRKHTCPECGTVLMVPFTCKSRLCLSCYRKKLYVWSMSLSNIMNTTLTHFHVTFTLPGPVTMVLFERRFSCEDLITYAAGEYWKELLKSAGDPGREWQAAGDVWPCFLDCFKKYPRTGCAGLIRHLVKSFAFSM